MKNNRFDKKLIRINKKYNEINLKRINIKGNKQMDISKAISISNKVGLDTTNLARAMMSMTERFSMNSVNLSKTMMPITERFRIDTANLARAMMPMTERFGMETANLAKAIMPMSERFRVDTANLAKAMMPLAGISYNSTAFSSAINSITKFNIDTIKISEAIKPLSSIACFSSELCKAVNKMSKINIESIDIMSKAFEFSQLSLGLSKIADSAIRLNIDTSNISKLLSHSIYDFSFKLSEIVKNISYPEIKPIDTSLLSSNLNTLSKAFSNAYNDNINRLISSLNIQLAYEFTVNNDITHNKFNINKFYSESLSLAENEIALNADGSVAIGDNTYNIGEISKLIKSIIDDCKSRSKHIEEFLNNLLLYTYTQVTTSIKPIIINIISSLILAIYILPHMSIQNGEVKPPIDYKKAAIEIKLSVSNINIDNLEQSLFNYRFVGVESLNIRSDGNSKAHIIGKLYFGDVVKVLDLNNNNWAYVKVDEGDKHMYGWVYRSYLQSFNLKQKGEVSINDR